MPFIQSFRDITKAFLASEYWCWYCLICFSAWLKDTVDPLLVTLDHRIAALTGLDVQPPYAEYLQVVNYGIGGHYEPHFDHATVTMGHCSRVGCQGMAVGALSWVGCQGMVCLTKAEPLEGCQGRWSEILKWRFLFQKYTAGEKGKWHSHLGNSLTFLKKLNVYLHVI